LGKTVTWSRVLGLFLSHLIAGLARRCVSASELRFAVCQERKVYMRNLAVLLAIVSFLVPSVASAQSSGVSSLQLAHSALRPGQTETVLVIARDLAGNPLSGAAVLAVVHFGSASQTFHMRQTDGRGRSALTFQPPTGLANVKGSINVTISNGYLQMSLSSTFTVGAPAAPPAPVSLVVQLRVLPAEVTAPAPAWVVASVHTRATRNLQFTAAHRNCA